MQKRVRRSILDPYRAHIESLLAAGCAYQQITDELTERSGKLISFYTVSYYCHSKGLRSRVTQGAKNGRIEIPNCSTCGNCLRAKDDRCKYDTLICKSEMRVVPRSCKTSPMWCHRRRVKEVSHDKL